MIEKVLLDYLNDSTLSVNAYMETPERVPSSYVLVEKTGSSRRNLIDSATIAIQSIAGSLYDAALLNEEVKALMDPFLVPSCISSCKLNSDYNFTDTRTKQYRYQAVFNLVYKEAE